MIDETIASHTLDGYRHLPIVAREAPARFLVRVGDIVAASPRDQRTRRDLNPVIASDTVIVLVDVRIILSKKHPGDHTKLRQGRTFPAAEGRGCCRGRRTGPGQRDGVHRGGDRRRNRPELGATRWLDTAC
ncbi:CoA-binding protein [Rhodococcus opacus RKJ300 = JCM 13270]|uniref:CoA-binding protein n=1 Tax=Rhodococcus opacus RKJ300 = JCM 13270 TaxID=1165867 RepID=I0WC30_RHOOP|nr:CoA-binding protein [Rhodococcus opacus RKJ300 = JCM 13270]QQZ16717.1 hypothetical protein GO592_11510 [Rhodococcus sp. 21391]